MTYEMLLSIVKRPCSWIRDERSLKQHWVHMRQIKLHILEIINFKEVQE